MAIDRRTVKQKEKDANFELPDEQVKCCGTCIRYSKIASWQRPYCKKHFFSIPRRLLSACCKDWKA